LINAVAAQTPAGIDARGNGGFLFHPGAASEPGVFHHRRGMFAQQGKVQSASDGLGEAPGAGLQ
jgi:hypothetical protein